MSYPTHVCTQCGSQVQPKSITPGSFGMELVLWLFFLLPGLIYSIWRISSRYKGCSVCGGKACIPLGTPAAKAISVALCGPTDVGIIKADGLIEADLPTSLVSRMPAQNSHVTDLGGPVDAFNPSR